MTTLKGAPNFRDLGGLPTADGRRLRRGRLFRSDALSRLGEADLERIAQLDIGVVCDLRGPAERAKEPNRWPAGRPLTTIACATEAALAGVKPTRWRAQFLDEGFDASRARESMLGAYARMPGAYAGQLAALFAHLEQSGGGPVLIHCLAGKDRTGFVCAMLLTALGVPEEQIYADYLLSTERFALTGRIEDMLENIFGAAVPPRARAAAAVVGGVSADFLKTALDVVAQRHGSIDHYLETEAGLGAARRSSLRGHLLEAA